MPAIALERIAIDDTPDKPEAKAQAIHEQLGTTTAPVQVHDIAHALDIAEIREEPLDSLEGALITGPERDFGIIAINSRSSLERRRFSLAHELGHFLCAWHQQTQDTGFACTRADMAWPQDPAKHRQQEAEANRFAIELLAPARFIQPYLRRLPDLDHVLAIRSALQISKAAAVRRYVSLHEKKVAAIFARDGAFNYVERASGFPYLAFQPLEPLPALPPSPSGGGVSEMIETDPQGWHLRSASGELACQILTQERGYAIVLLYLEG